mmetsp:Transcript_96543/g.191353  ORF Transcript_96543/g.191353 Transcript_96543/m.191353 type:complete len:343 (-) Transcript_96543:89-1117(-)
MSRPGFVFLDAYGFEKAGRQRRLFLDFDAMRAGLELEFNCVFSEKHYFNSVTNPLAKTDYHLKLQRLGWTLHLFGLKKFQRRVTADGESSVTFTSDGGLRGKPAVGIYEFEVQAGVDSALVTAMSMLHSKAPNSAVFLLIASDGDFHQTLTKLRDGGRDVFVVFWECCGPGNPLAASLTTFLKTKPRLPGEDETYFFLDEILVARTSDSSAPAGVLGTSGNQDGNDSSTTHNEATDDRWPDASNGNIPSASNCSSRFVGRMQPNRICTFWLQSPAACKKGTDCTFAHGVQELHPSAVATCGISRFHHCNFKPTRMCSYHSNGVCTKGMACTFAHSHDELRCT